MRKKEVIVLVTIVLVLAIVLSFQATAISNPSSVYCEALGHTYSAQRSADGSELGICEVEGTQCDEWEFYSGNCRPDRSACAEEGYDTVTVNGEGDPYSEEYALCVEEGKGDMITGSAVSETTGEGLIGLFKKLISYLFTGNTMTGMASTEEVFTVTAQDLVGLEEKMKECDDSEPPPESSGDEGEGGDASITGDGAPASFDWRDYNSENWVTPVKNQGGCGSCWAFGTLGSIEAKHNILNNNAALDADLSEDYLVSSCALTAGTCCGGWSDVAHAFVRDSGVPDESCLPYAESCSCDVSCTGCSYGPYPLCADRTCSDRCGNWASRLWTTSGFVYSSSLADSTVKQRLVDNGPLTVSLGIGSDYGGSWDGDVYRCTLDSGTNHCVLLVGYDDAGGYWIIKNSWGSSWNGDGYYKLGYGECGLSKFGYVSGITTTHPTTTISSPSDGLTVTDSKVDFYFQTDTLVSGTATCEVYVGGTVENTSSTVSDSVNTSLSAVLTDGTHTWYTRCWENSNGAIDSSSSRTVEVDTTPPSVTILSPQDQVYNSTPVSLSYTASDSSGLGACILTNTTGQNETLAGCTGKSMTVAEGNHTIMLYVNDTLGWMAVETQDFDVDLNPPGITFEDPTPADGSGTTDVEVVINVSATDSMTPVDSCVLEWDGVNESMQMTGTGLNVMCNKTKHVVGTGTSFYTVHVIDTVGHSTAETRNVTILNTAPTMTSHYPSSNDVNIAEPQNQMFNVTHDDINGDTVTAYWMVNGTSAGTGGEYYFMGNYTSVGVYNITCRLSDGQADTYYNWTLTISNTNRPPEAQDVNLVSSDALNRTNGTLSGSWQEYDADGDAVIDNETRWYNGSLEVLDLWNMTSADSSYTLQGQQWTFSVRIYDGDWSEWINSTTLTVQNIPPVLDAIADVEVNESEWVNITAVATDDDALTYSISDLRFTQSGNHFSWKTTTSDSGTYVFGINVSDGSDTAHQDVNVEVHDVPDFDDDGNPDFNDTDDDNDGLPDAGDTLLGNASDINTTLPGLRLIVNQTDDLLINFNDTLDVNVTDANNETLVYFDWDFNQSDLYMNWTIEYNATNGSMRITGLDLASQGSTKTIYINKTSGSNSVCIADDETTIWVSDDCSGHTRLSCGSSGQCTDIGDRYKVTGLTHTFVKTIYVAPAQPPSGGGGGGGGGSSATTTSIVPTLDGVDVSLRRTDNAEVHLNGDSYAFSVTSMGIADIMFNINGYFYTLTRFDSEIRIDVDHDARRDLVVQLRSINGGKAELTFTLYQEPERVVPVQPADYTRRRTAEPQVEEAPAVVEAAPAVVESRTEASQEALPQPALEEPATISIPALFSMIALAIIIFVVIIASVYKFRPQQLPTTPPARTEPAMPKPAAPSQEKILVKRLSFRHPTIIRPKLKKVPARKGPVVPVPQKRSEVHDLNDEIGEIKKKIEKLSE